MTFDIRGIYSGVWMVMPPQTTPHWVCTVCNTSVAPKGKGLKKLLQLHKKSCPTPKLRLVALV